MNYLKTSGYPVVGVSLTEREKESWKNSAMNGAGLLALTLVEVF